MKNSLLKLIALTLIISMLFPTVAHAIESTKDSVIMEYLEAEIHPYASAKHETRYERHDRLLSEGYELCEISQVNTTDNMYITGPDGLLYETRVSTLTYRQPNNTEVKYGENYLNVITTSTVGQIIDTILGFIPRVGWIPSLLGINTVSLADFLSRGRVTHISDSTLFYYEIEVKLAGTNNYYFVASSQRYEIAITAVSSGFTQLGSPVQKTVSGSTGAQSMNYGNESVMSQIAVYYFVTGGPVGDYMYFEYYTPPTYVYLN